MRQRLSVFAVAAVLLLGCGQDPAQRVSEHERLALPTEQMTLGSDLCPEEFEARNLPRREVRRRQRNGRRPTRRLGSQPYARHPDAIVKTTYLSSDQRPRRGRRDHSLARSRPPRRRYRRGVSPRPACFQRTARRLPNPAAARAGANARCLSAACRAKPLPLRRPAIGYAGSCRPGPGKQREQSTYGADARPPSIDPYAEV